MSATTYVEKDREYEEKRAALRDKITLRQQQIERLERRLSKLNYGPYWVDEIIKPLAEEMIKHFPGRVFDILGPFGMGCHVSIHFYKEGLEGMDRFGGDNCISITFTPLDLEGKGEIGVVNQSVDTQEYTTGTLGALNGMNHPVIPVPADVGIKWFLAWAT